MSFVIDQGIGAQRWKLFPTDTDLPKGRRDSKGRTLKKLRSRSTKRGKRPKFGGKR